MSIMVIRLGAFRRWLLCSSRGSNLLFGRINCLNLEALRIGITLKIRSGARLMPSQKLSCTRLLNLDVIQEKQVYATSESSATEDLPEKMTLTRRAAGPIDLQQKEIGLADCTLGRQALMFPG